jgi:hypothetical protein
MVVLSLRGTPRLSSRGSKVLITISQDKIFVMAYSSPALLVTVSSFVRRQYSAYDLNFLAKDCPPKGDCFEACRSLPANDY